MSTIILRLSLILAVFFGGGLLVIHAQPYRHHPIHDLLLPQDCNQPCLMGIQPGVTTPQEALLRLRNSEWVGKVGVSEELQTVAWRWSDMRIGLMDSDQLSGLFYDRDSVRAIRLYTDVSLGDLLLELGGTTGLRRVAVSRSNALVSNFRGDVFYNASSYIISATVSCRNFWDQPANLVLSLRPRSLEGFGRITYGLNRARRLIAVTCRRLKEL
ncbi:MAG: hypothetical protein R3E39_31105 [Anaerolineae bacterium]